MGRNHCEYKGINIKDQEQYYSLFLSKEDEIEIFIVLTTIAIIHQKLDALIL